MYMGVNRKALQLHAVTFFISQLWRKIGLRDKSGSGLGTRLHIQCGSACQLCYAYGGMLPLSFIRRVLCIICQNLSFESWQLHCTIFLFNHFVVNSSRVMNLSHCMDALSWLNAEKLLSLANL